MPEVQIISAPWCKRCKTIKPDVANTCTLSGVALTEVNYDEMVETDKETIKSLPTIRVRPDPGKEWVVYTADTLDEFKSAMMTAAIADTDF
jgi:hypothetical protein